MKRNPCVKCCFFANGYHPADALHYCRNCARDALRQVAGRDRLIAQLVKAAWARNDVVPEAAARLVKAGKR